MTGILIVTHHNLAQAFMETIEMIAGKHEFLDSLGLVPSQDPESFQELILSKVHGLKTKGYDEIAVVLDLYGGTPCNQTIRLLREHQLKVIVGVNLASKKSDKEHQYGHERMECVAAIVLSMVLFMTGLGIGVEARAVIIFTGCFVATVLNTYTGIRSTNQTLVNVAKTCGAGNLKIFWTVGVPSAMPMIFAGLKTSMGSAWGTIVAAEMLASSNGLGYMIQMGRSFGDVSLIMAGIIVIGILGFVSSGIVSLVESMALKWRPKK